MLKIEIQKINILSKLVCDKYKKDGIFEIIFCMNREKHRKKNKFHSPIFKKITDQYKNCNIPVKKKQKRCKNFH